MLQVYDGVATFTRGDLVSVVYERAARLPRTRWLFDRIDEFAEGSPGDKMTFLIILPNADPPDRMTRAENNARLRKLGPSLRRIVTVPIGDAFRMTIVRSVMRAMTLLQGQARTNVVADSVPEGIARLLEARTGATPTARLIEGDLQTMYRALGPSISLSA
jgi:hypothetical protein